MQNQQLLLLTTPPAMDPHIRENLQVNWTMNQIHLKVQLSEKVKIISGVCYILLKYCIILQQHDCCYSYKN